MYKEGTTNGLGGANDAREGLSSSCACATASSSVLCGGASLDGCACEKRRVDRLCILLELHAAHEASVLYGSHSRRQSEASALLPTRPNAGSLGNGAWQVGEAAGPSPLQHGRHQHAVDLSRFLFGVYDSFLRSSSRSLRIASFSWQSPSYKRSAIPFFPAGILS